ncbi:hypothetical protein TNCV_2365561 [Trichonephila clavipes]|nr:hypothetical protein TNCV_2365561 [Trichonephila clavipes]
MSPGRCNIGLTTPRHAEYQIINLILGNITPLIKQCPSEYNALSKFKSVDRRGIWGLTGIHKQKFIGQTNAYDIPIDVAHALSGTKNNFSQTSHPAPPYWCRIQVRSEYAGQSIRAISHPTGLRAYRPMCPKRLYV